MSDSPDLFKELCNLNMPLESASNATSNDRGFHLLAQFAVSLCPHLKGATRSRHSVHCSRFKMGVCRSSFRKRPSQVIRHDPFHLLRWMEGFQDHSARTGKIHVFNLGGRI